MYFNCKNLYLIKYEINKYNQINQFMQPHLKPSTKGDSRYFFHLYEKEPDLPLSVL